MTDPASASRASKPVKRTSSAWFVSVAFVLLALLIWSDPLPFVSPVPAEAVVPSWVTDVTPVRQPAFVPEIQHVNFTYRCGECHGLFPSPPETVRTLTQHRHITLKHGLNTRCMNCHHLENREAFVDAAGKTIPYGQPQLLCAKCHGPVYRDWLHGSHGRTNGYWDTAEGLQERKKCIECHDPHQPPFPPMSPAPPPNTLRMGDQQSPLEHGEIADPLRIRDRAATADADAAHGDGGENLSSVGTDGWRDTHTHLTVRAPRGIRAAHRI